MLFFFFSLQFKRGQQRQRKHGYDVIFFANPHIRNTFYILIFWQLYLFGGQNKQIRSRQFKIKVLKSSRPKRKTTYRTKSGIFSGFSSVGLMTRSRD